MKLSPCRLLYALFCLFFCFIALSAVQAQAVTFDDLALTDGAVLGNTLETGDLRFSCLTREGGPALGTMQYESAAHQNGFAGSGLLYVGDPFSMNDPYYFSIQTNDGSQRDFQSIYIREFTGISNINLTAEAYRDGLYVGEQDLFTHETAGQYLFSPLFDNVDEIRLRQRTPAAFDGFSGVVFAFDQVVAGPAFLILPLRFGAIHARAKAEGILVNWEVESEQGRGVYQVEHSRNGAHFQPLAHLQGKESGARGRYEFLHASPGRGTHYYRIRHRSASGRATYSDITKIDLSEPLGQAPGLRVIHAGSGTLTAQVANGGGKCHFTLHARSGRLLQQWQSGGRGVFFELPLHQKPASGIYFLHLVTEDGRKGSVSFFLP